MERQASGPGVAVPASLIYPKKLIGLPVNLWMVVMLGGLFAAGLAMIAFQNLTVFALAGVGTGGVLFGVFYAWSVHDPFLWTRIEEFLVVGPYLPSGDTFVGGRGKRYVP